MKNARYAISVFGLLVATIVRSLAQSGDQPYTFTTLAGGGGYSTNVAGSAARLWWPAAVAVDGVGNVYVVENGNDAISKVTPEGALTTFAGRPGSLGSANGTGSAARFYGPLGAAVDDAGNVYVADTGNHTIRKVTPAGVVTTLAGQAGSSGTANGTGPAARFNYPNGVAVDGAGNVYVADTANNTIRKVTPAGVVTTLAGLAGRSGSADGTNSAARFNFPTALALDSRTNLYVTDTSSHTIRKVTPVGPNWVVTTLAGMAGSSGSADGATSDARFNEPNGVAVDSSGNLYVADAANSTIRQIAPLETNWVVTTIAGVAGSPGSANGTNSEARFNLPTGTAVDSAGNVYVAEVGNGLVRRIVRAGTNWVVTTLAGTAEIHGSTDGTGLDTQFHGPFGVASDSSGNLYVADQINHTIRKVSRGQGIVTTLAGLAGYAGSADGAGSNARFRSPSGVAVDGAGNVYVADSWNSTIRKVTPEGVVTTLAGLPGIIGGDDGTNSDARFAVPNGVAVDSAGNLYVADTIFCTIRKVAPVGTNWVVTTLAGLADFYGSQNGTGPNARFYVPTSVAVDSAGNVYVADTLNHMIRKVTPAGVVTTFAGVAGSVGSVDGTGTAARFYAPSGVAVDSADNVYVADTYNNTIRKITPARVVTTLGGMPDNIGTANGTGSAARFSNPAGLAVDGDGNVYVADFYFNTIRKGYPPPRILNSGFASGRFGFDLTAPPGQSIVVDASSDLADWFPVWTNSVGGGLTFSDPQGVVSSNRFYRARAQ